MSAVILGPDGLPIIDMAKVEKELEGAISEPRRFDPAGNLIVSEVDGVVQTLSFDDAADTFTYNWATDAEPIIEANKQLQADGYTGMTKDKSLKHVARIDAVTAKLWEIMYGLDWNRIGSDPEHDRKLDAILNDPDWRLCRTGGGRV